MLFARPKRRKGIITDRKQLEQIFQHLAITVEQMSEGIAVVDAGGVVHFINTAWAQMHGYDSSSELLEKDIDTFYVQKAPMGRIEFCFEQARKRTVYCVTRLHRRVDGSTFPTRTKVIALHDETGEINGFMILAMDITRAAMAEAELADMTRKVEQLQNELQTLDNQCNQGKQKQNLLQEKLSQMRAENLKFQQQAAVHSESQQQWSERDRQLDDKMAELLAENEELQSANIVLEDSKQSLHAMVEQLTTANEEMQGRLGRPEFDSDSFDEDGDYSSRNLGDRALFDSEKLKSLANLAKRLS